MPLLRVAAFGLASCCCTGTVVVTRQLQVTVYITLPSVGSLPKEDVKVRRACGVWRRAADAAPVQVEFGRRSLDLQVRAGVAVQGGRGGCVWMAVLLLRVAALIALLQVTGLAGLNYRLLVPYDKLKPLNPKLKPLISNPSTPKLKHAIVTCLQLPRQRNCARRVHAQGEQGQVRGGCACSACASVWVELWAGFVDGS